MNAPTITCKVAEVEDLTPDVFGVTLEGRPEAMSHAPGQYLELGLDENTWVPFSIASPERGDGRLELHIQHWPERDKSVRLRHLLQVANHLDVRLAGGDCVADLTSQRPLVLIVAGTGFAQAKAMIEAVLSHQPGRPIELWWAAREQRDLYLESLASQWALENAQLTFHAVTEEPLAAPLPECDRIRHHIGRIDEVMAATEASLDGTDMVLSGSPGMVYAVLDVLEPKGIDNAHVLSDVFAYAPR